MLLLGLNIFSSPQEEKYVHGPGVCVLFDFLHSQLVLEFFYYFCNMGILTYATLHGPFSFFCLLLFSNLLTQGN